MLTINSPITLEMAEELAGEYDALVEEEQEVELDFGEKICLRNRRQRSRFKKKDHLL